MGNTNIDEDILGLSKVCIDAHGEFRPFDEQLDRYAYGEVASGDMLVVAQSSHDVGLYEIDPLPILIKQTTIRKIQLDHDIALSQLSGLSRWLEEHPLALDSLTEPDAIVVITQDIDRYDNPIIIAMHLGKEKREIVINEIASIYGKNNLGYMLETALDAKKHIYTNRRTDAWIQRTGVPFPERIAKRLQDDDSKNIIYIEPPASICNQMHIDPQTHKPTPAELAASATERAEAINAERTSAPSQTRNQVR